MEGAAGRVGSTQSGSREVKAAVQLAFSFPPSLDPEHGTMSPTRKVKSSHVSVI